MGLKAPKMGSSKREGRLRLRTQKCSIIRKNSLLACKTCVLFYCGPTHGSHQLASSYFALFGSRKVCGEVMDLEGKFWEERESGVFSGQTVPHLMSLLD